MRTRVIGYARVSTEKQDLERQRILIKEYCDENDYLLCEIIEEKVSGAKENRESINRLRTINSDIADLVVVSELSRLSREEDAMNLLVLVNDILKSGVDVHFIDEPNQVYHGGSCLKLFDIIMLSFKATAAAEERKKIITRMKTGKSTKVETNPYMYAGGTPPYGYKTVPNPQYNGQKDNIPAKSLMVIDPVKMEEVKLIYNMILNSTTLRDAAKRMNELGAKTQLGKPFCETSIAKIVRNPIYNGRRRFKGLNLQTEKIISDDDWNRAQICISENKLYKDTATHNFNPLKGIVFCPCGYALMLHQMRDHHFIMQCCKKNDMEYRKVCKNSGIRSDVLFPTVWKCVSLTLSQTDYQEKTTDEVARLIQYKGSLQIKISDLKEKTIRYQKEKDNIANALLTIDPSITSLVNRYQEEYVKKETEIIELNNQIESVLLEISQTENKIKNLNIKHKSERLSKLSDEEKSVIYKKVLKRVVYYSVDFRNGFIVIDYKNGMRNIVAIKKHYNAAQVLLPTGFSFNEGNRSVSVEINKVNKENPFEFNIQRSEYSIFEFFKSFPWEEWSLDISSSV